MVEKLKTIGQKSLDFFNSQWWGLKVIYWILISLVIIITTGYLLFRKPKTKAIKIR